MQQGRSNRACESASRPPNARQTGQHFDMWPSCRCTPRQWLQTNKVTILSIEVFKGQLCGEEATEAGQSQQPRVVKTAG